MTFAHRLVPAAWRGWLLAHRLRPHLHYLSRHRRGLPVIHPDRDWPTHMRGVLRALDRHPRSELEAAERHLRRDHRVALRRLTAAYYAPLQPDEEQPCPVSVDSIRP